MRILIKGGNAVLGDCQKYTLTDILTEDGIIVKELTAPPDVTINADGKYILPGLIDIHTHGSVGINYSKDKIFDTALSFSASQGVTSVVPTVGVRPFDDILNAIKNIVLNAKRSPIGASVEGIHIEGPFVSPKKIGAMNQCDIPCTVENFNRIYGNTEGYLKIMTIAPEAPGALDVIREGASKSIRMSIGHTDASYGDAIRAINAGASGATHIFNAMRAFTHRDPGVIAAILTELSVTCEVICDMVHLAPATVKLVKATKGLDGMILVSDSGMITGLGDGDYDVDGKIRSVKGGISRNSEGTIAGSTFTMSDGARNLIELGFTHCDIAKIGALNPAKAIGADGYIGSLDTGKRADIIIVDEKFNVENVIIKGKLFPTQ